jgi:hypothetical protein
MVHIYTHRELYNRIANIESMIIIAKKKSEFTENVSPKIIAKFHYSIVDAIILRNFGNFFYECKYCHEEKLAFFHNNERYTW